MQLCSLLELYKMMSLSWSPRPRHMGTIVQLKPPPLSYFVTQLCPISIDFRHRLQKYHTIRIRPYVYVLLLHTFIPDCKVPRYLCLALCVLMVQRPQTDILFLGSKIRDWIDNGDGEFLNHCIVSFAKYGFLVKMKSLHQSVTKSFPPGILFVTFLQIT